MIFEVLAAIAESPEYERRRARNARKAKRAATVTPNGRVLEARRAAYYDRLQNAKDLRRVIRKAAKGEPIPARLVPQVARMRALSGGTQAERDAALGGRGLVQPSDRYRPTLQNPRAYTGTGPSVNLATLQGMRGRGR